MELTEFQNGNNSWQTRSKSNIFTGLEPSRKKGDSTIFPLKCLNNPKCLDLKVVDLRIRIKTITLAEWDN